jgi:ribosomal-protein-alanine N-acetyltransferase
VIRGATAADYDAYAALFRELGFADPTPSYQRFAGELTRSTLVADRGGSVAGYIDFYALSAAGHVRNVVVAPAARNSGIGAELMRAVADRLRAAGITEWHLNVRRDNAAAIRLYEKMGMQIEHRSTVFRIPWAIAETLPREAATVSDVSPEDDDDLERALTMLSGRIAMRRRGNSILIQLRDDSCAAVGFAALDVGVGASPFRVARPALIGTLLDAIRPHVTAPYVQIVVEDCPECQTMLATAGAEVALELLHYRGTLA